MHKSLFPLSLIVIASVGNAAEEEQETLCNPTPPITCEPADCKSCYCLGPDNYGVNAAVGPKTCNGDFFINLAGFYWNAHQDGMEYAIKMVGEEPGASPSSSTILPLNNVDSGKYRAPDFEWDFGFKLGIGYTTCCDGWDIGAQWTWYRTKTKDSDKTEGDDTRLLLPLWSAFSPTQGLILYADNIDLEWKLEMNLIDIELGRQFWTSKYVSIRPHVGLRIAYLKQNYDIQNSGGSWNARDESIATPPVAAQGAYNNFIELENDYKGIGIRSGLDSEWNFGCGWALYGNFAASIVYGRFSIDHNEMNRLTTNLHDKQIVLDAKDSFRASRGMLDLALGLQWSSMLWDACYGFTARVGWEHHLFFHQNQMWRVNRINDAPNADPLPNNTGENVFEQRRGNLDTQGWTVSFKLEF